MIRKNINLTIILIIIVIVLAAIILITLIVKPEINKYSLKEQTSGYETAILTIMQLASTCQSVPLTSGNITIELIWTNCLQIQGSEVNLSG